MNSKSQSKQTALKITTTVTLSADCFGTPRPQIELCFPKGSHHRAVSAALYKLAAEVELATPERERWRVRIDTFDDHHGCVYLELLDGMAPEVERGMTVLRKVAG